MKNVVEKLKEYESPTPSRWREEAQWRQENKLWLRYSQLIAIKMLERMEELGITQKALAERLHYKQQYVSKVLKGRENLNLDTLSKIENALGLHLICETEQQLV